MILWFCDLWILYIHAETHSQHPRPPCFPYTRILRQSILNSFHGPTWIITSSMSKSLLLTNIVKTLILVRRMLKHASSI